MDTFTALAVLVWLGTLILNTRLPIALGACAIACAALSRTLGSESWQVLVWLWALFGGLTVFAFLANRLLQGGGKRTQRSTGPAQSNRRASRDTASPQQQRPRTEAPKADRQEEPKPANTKVAAEESWWDVLGVSPHSSLVDVKRAYRGLVQQYHPDRVHGLGPELIALAEARTAKLNAALDEAERALGPRGAPA
jgi:hypothetical protein